MYSFEAFEKARDEVLLDVVLGRKNDLSKLREIAKDLNGELGNQLAVEEDDSKFMESVNTLFDQFKDW